MNIFSSTCCKIMISKYTQMTLKLRIIGIHKILEDIRVNYYHRILHSLAIIYAMYTAVASANE